MTIGTVKFFNESKGYGFIAPDGGGNDAFVHISDVERSGMSGLRENQRVSYDLKQDDRGKTSATNLKAVDADASAELANDQAADAPSGEAE
jgi:CspA family cold shock protein